jgi:aldose 1-epimerase
VVLGFDNLAAYEGKHPHFGGTIGRVANRIARGEFELDGQRYTLAKNNGPNTLHGGLIGFDKRHWKVAGSSGESVTLAYLSPDGEEGFPGNLSARVTYSLNETNELAIDFHAVCDARTIVNMTNHSYFNLKGAGRGDVLNHVLELNADHYTPADAQLIPTGQIAPVKGTPLDFTKPMPIGARIEQALPGYDHNFVLNGPVKNNAPAFAARALDPESGRVMEVYTTQPGVQLYTGIHLDGSLSGLGGAYIRYGALCLETQHFPDTPHHPNFPSIILTPGGQYAHRAVYRFSA